MEEQKNSIKKIDISSSQIFDVFESTNKDVQLKQGTVLQLKDLTALQKKQTRFVTSYHWKKEYGGDDHHYPIISTETVTYFVKGIIQQNVSEGFSLWSVVGKSGTGKTTLVTTGVHRMHQLLSEMGYEYVISWYRRQAVGKIDTIVDSLPKGVNRIIVFDDATFGDRDLTEEEAKTLIARLTYIRHDLQANVICIIITHYSKGLGPFLRDGDITTWTSSTHIEKENMLKTYGWDNKAIIRKFFKKFGSMRKNGFFTSEINESKVIYNYNRRPFRIAFCVDYDSMHFTAYPAEKCSYCEPKFDDSFDLKKRLESASEQELIRKLQDSYKKPSYIKQAYRWSFYFKAGIEDCVEPKHKAILNHIHDYYEKHPDEYRQICAELKSGKSIDTVLIARGLNIKRTDAENALQRRIKNRERVRRIRREKEGGGDGTSGKYEKRETAVGMGDVTKEEVRQYEKQDQEYDEDGFDVKPTWDNLEAAGVHTMDSGLRDDDDDESMSESDDDYGEFEN